MVEVDPAPPISATPPPDFFVKHIKEIEDIGEPINPCFFTYTNTNPTDWYIYYFDLFIYLFIYLFFFSLGGYSKNMMEFEDFGIP